MIPHLNRNCCASFNELERCLIAKAPDIERWFRLEWLEHTPPFYTSVDIRNAGHKLAPVDTNLFPGGWNNLDATTLPLAVQAAQLVIERSCPDARNLLLIPENHTRNTFYLSNVLQLQKILCMAGLQVRLGSLNPEIIQPTPVELANGGALLLEPLVRGPRRLGLKDFDPCTIVLNNDLSAGTPAILQGLSEQFLLPPLHAGWSLRRKTQHFAAYDQVTHKFAAMLGTDPWLINPFFTSAGGINFQAGLGIAELQDRVSDLLGRIRAEYARYKIEERPYVVIKANNGTYGMGIMMVKSASELDILNRKIRNKMSVVKDGQQVSEFIIQEGVHTQERVNEAVAEPVVYMLDRFVVGGFYRIHAERGEDENLNAPGASFVPLPFDHSAQLTTQEDSIGRAVPNRFYVYGVIARLAMLAASYELEATAEVKT